ncbi:MAG: hypothetical protein D6741_10110 [Planctomycetota bacterium]|nr:MAG: hypothetical protein D6741_10110 [Planctomycetota bacterium]
MRFQADRIHRQDASYSDLPAPIGSSATAKKPRPRGAQVAFTLPEPKKAKTGFRITDLDSSGKSGPTVVEQYAI